MMKDIIASVILIAFVAPLIVMFWFKWVGWLYQELFDE